MPRDSFGNWVNYPGNPVTTGTTIASAWWNGTYTDLGSSMGASLDRTGATGGMTGQFKAADGTSGAPGISFGSSPDLGFYIPTPGELDAVVGGTRLVRWTTTNFFQVTQDNGATWLDLVYQNKSATLTGAAAGLGLTVGSTAANIDVEKVNGYIDFSGATNPAATTGFANRLTPKNIPKAYIRLSTNGGGGVTVTDGFNVATGSLVLGLLGITVPFATAMANTDYLVVGNASAGQALAFFVNTRNTNSVIIYVMTYAALGTPLNPNTNSFSFEFAVYGAQ